MSGLKMPEPEVTVSVGSDVGFDCCPDWKPQCDLVNGPIINQTLRSGGRYTYTGIPFRFCPWCGAKRIREQQE